RATALPIGRLHAVADAASRFELVRGIAGYDSVSCIEGSNRLFDVALNLNSPHVERHLGLDQLRARLPAVALVAIEDGQRKSHPSVPRRLAGKADGLPLVLIGPAG